MSFHTKYLPPRFFLSAGEEGKLGTSILMIVEKCDTKESAYKTIGEKEISLSVTYSEKEDDVDINITIYQKEHIQRSISLEDIQAGKYFVAMLPLIDNVWELEKKKQTKIAKFTKQALFSEMLIGNMYLNIDISKIGIVLEDYSILNEEVNGSQRYGFVQLKEEGYLQISSPRA